MYEVDGYKACIELRNSWRTGTKTSYLSYAKSRDRNIGFHGVRNTFGYNQTAFEQVEKFSIRDNTWHGSYVDKITIESA